MIDWEYWRPVFDRNWDKLSIYRSVRILFCLQIVEHFECWASILGISKEIKVATIAVDEAKILGIKARMTLLFQSTLVKNLPKNCAAWSEFLLCLLKQLLSWFSLFQCVVVALSSLVALFTTQNLFLILLNISPEKKLIWWKARDKIGIHRYPFRGSLQVFYMSNINLR